jgi:hypothetical protein
MPPFRAMETLAGLPCLDGGLVDPAPVDVVADVPGSTLVLLTRHRRGLSPVFVRDGRVYVQPSRPIGVGRWDYTAPSRLRAAYDLGVADGTAFVALFVHDRMPAALPPPAMPVPNDGSGGGSVEGWVSRPRATPVLLAP